MPENIISTADRKPTRLEGLLNDDQIVLERATNLRRRIEEMEVRLFGDKPKVATDDDSPIDQVGILGNFSKMNADTVQVLEEISESLTRIESAV